MDLNASQREKHLLLEQSLEAFAPPAEGGRERGPSTGSAGNEAICAIIKREEELQFRFMALYQVLVAVLAVTTLALLVWAAWSITDAATSEAALIAAGAIATGVGAGFLIAQRKDARDTWKAAKASFAKHGCT